MSKHTLPKAARDNRANQLNPAHPSFYRSRGIPEAVADQHAERARADQRPAEPPTTDESAASGNEGTEG
ncbi:MAG TPA: hypothetical protein PLI95_05555 [Polyangiaceae bacterium]|nr:hypothetical protein [Polyangiaceae bacterium]